MIQGTMKWTSPTREFGLLTPHEGSRDIFVRFASAILSTCTSDGRGGFAVKDAVAPAPPLQQVASTVEVRTRYERGQWAGGYEIAQCGWGTEYAVLGRWTHFQTLRAGRCPACRRLIQLTADQPAAHPETDFSRRTDPSTQ